MSKTTFTNRLDTESANIRIVIAGHTNTGKTTLIRTLMSSAVGEVDDAPIVTKKGKAYFYERLQTTFIDTPGFQYASIVLLWYNAKQQYSDFSLPKTWEAKVNFDLDAITAIQDSDVALYVGSLSVVPDDSYREEISLVRKIQPKVVAILNHYVKQVEASSEEAVNHRINLWKQLFKEQGIECVIVFDARWDNPINIDQIYDSVYKILEPEHKDIFSGSRSGSLNFPSTALPKIVAN